MSRRLQIALVVAVMGLLVAALGAYAWDRARGDQIAEGVTIGGVDVGGLTAEEAKGRLDAALLEPLNAPVTVRYDGTKYVLSPGELDLRADLDAVVDAALDESREGWLGARVWRYATGGEVDEAIRPRISYSEEALDAFIAEVEGEINREPRDATVEPSAATLSKVPAQSGVSVRSDELRREVRAAIQSPNFRSVRAEVEKVKPDITMAELAEQYPIYLTVDRSTFKLRLWRNLELAETYPIAVGAVGWDTPAGLYGIQNKAVDPAWSVPQWGGELAGKVIPGGAPNNPLKERWLGIYDGAGIHGTDDVGSLGSAASHGCIRMAIPDVIELYDEVPVGTPIYIA